MKRKRLVFRGRLRRTFCSKRIRLLGKGSLVVLLCIGIGAMMGGAYAVFDFLQDLRDSLISAADGPDWMRGRGTDLTLEGALNGLIIGCLVCVIHFVLTHPDSRRPVAEHPPDYDSSVWPPPPITPLEQANLHRKK